MGKLKNIGWTIGGVLALLSSIFIFSSVGSSSFIGVLFILAAIVILVLGSVYFYLKVKAKPKTTTEMNSLVVVEALKRVFKVVTAEGHFTEIVDYRETKQRLSVWPSTKKALIIVKAHVQMGYDFSKIKWEIDETNGKVKLQAIPAPYILSISPDINYYNLANGLFNKFTNEDFNLIQAQCIATVREVAEKSELPHLAAEQAKMLLTELASMHHWEIEGVKLLDN